MKFKKGQKLICIHYKDTPVIKVIEHNINNEVWVVEAIKKSSSKLTWWGPPHWFKTRGKSK